MYIYKYIYAMYSKHSKMENLSSTHVSIILIDPMSSMEENCSVLIANGTILSANTVEMITSMVSNNAIREISIPTLVLPCPIPTLPRESKYSGCILL